MQVDVNIQTIEVVKLTVAKVSELIREHLVQTLGPKWEKAEVAIWENNDQWDVVSDIRIEARLFEERQNGNEIS